MEAEDMSESVKLLTVKELAQLIRVPASWIYQRTRMGQSAIPHVKFGKYVRFDAQEVYAFFQRKDTAQRQADGANTPPNS